MCNLSEGIYERGMSQGMAQGAENKLIEVKYFPFPYIVSFR